MENRYVINDTPLQAGTIVADEKFQQLLTGMFYNTAQQVEKNNEACAEMRGNEKRELQYINVLSNLYYRLGIFEKNNPYNLTVKNLRKQITQIFPEMAKAEYGLEPVPQDFVYTEETAAEAIKYYRIYSEKILYKIKGDPQSFEMETATKAKLQQFVVTMTNFISSSRSFSSQEQTFPGKYNLLNLMEGLTDQLQKKLKGEKVVYSAKKLSEKQTEIVEQIQRVLNAKEINSDFSQKSLQRMSNFLATLGLGVAMIKNPQYQTVEEKNIAHAKSKVMRAAWEGMIRKPAYATLSDSLKNWMKEIPDTTKKYMFSDYNLDNSPVWQICRQMPQFRGEIVTAMIEEMQKLRFPPEKIDNLTYEDFAYFITSALSDKKRTSKEGKDYVLCYPCEKKEYYQNLVKNYHNELRQQIAGYIRPKITTELQKENRQQRLTAEDIQQDIEKAVKKYTDNILSSMKKGCINNDAFNAHHNFPLDNIEYFEQITGKPFTEINEYVTLINKNIHDGIVHQTENNVDSDGKICEKWFGGKSYRTNWLNKENAKFDENGVVIGATEAYSLLIFVQPGVKTIIDEQRFILDKENIGDFAKYQQDLLDCAKLKNLNEKMLKQQNGQNMTTIFKLPSVMPEKQQPFFAKVREILGSVKAKYEASRVKNMKQGPVTTAKIVPIQQKTDDYPVVERRIASR